MSSLLLYLEKAKTSYKSNEFKKHVFLKMNQRGIYANEVLSKIASKYSLATINAFDFFCDSMLKECTVVDDLGYPFFFDQVHFTKNGVIAFSPWFSKELRAKVGF
jgi:lysophospholipase L1-like esterase